LPTFFDLIYYRTLCSAVVVAVECWDVYVHYDGAWWGQDTNDISTPVAVCACGIMALSDQSPVTLQSHTDGTSLAVTSITWNKSWWQHKATYSKPLSCCRSKCSASYLIFHDFE